MAFDLGTAVLRHDANDDAADNRNEDHPRSQVMRSYAGEVRGKAVEEEKVGDDPDELVESVGDNARHKPNSSGEK